MRALKAMQMAFNLRTENIQKKHENDTHTPTPWLMRIRFMHISLTQLLKRFPFLT